MCSNLALLDDLEYSMSLLVDSFLDFAKKTLCLVSLAVGAILMMVVYGIGVMNSRSLRSAYESSPPISTIPPDSRKIAASKATTATIQLKNSKGFTRVQSSTSIDCCNSDEQYHKNNMMLQSCDEQTCRSAYTLPIPVSHACDERAHKDQDLSCRNPRATISSFPILPEKQQRSCVSIPGHNASSCCSQCCNDEAF